MAAVKGMPGSRLRSGGASRGGSFSKVRRWSGGDAWASLGRLVIVVSKATRRGAPGGGLEPAMNARMIATLLVVLASAFSFAPAGEIYGKVVEGASSVGEAATLEIKCGAKAYPAVKTDKSGSYRMILAETGKCAMTVKYRQQSASLDIASYEDAVQVDLVLAIKDG